MNVHPAPSSRSVAVERGRGRGKQVQAPQATSWTAQFFQELPLEQFVLAAADHRNRLFGKQGAEKPGHFRIHVRLALRKRTVQIKNNEFFMHYRSALRNSRQEATRRKLVASGN